MRRKRLILVLAVAAMASAPRLRADVVQLVNGDTINGTVRSMDETQLKLQSDVLGEMTLPREKVTAIYLGDAKPPAAPVAQPAAAPGIGAGILGPPGMTVEEVLRQMQDQGVDIRDVNELQKQFPLLAVPEARDYFNRTMGGLMDGSVSIQDVRRDAIQARNMLQELKAELRGELGPSADPLLNSYMGILDNFIRQTEPPKPEAPAPVPETAPPPARSEFPPRTE